MFNAYIQAGHSVRLDFRRQYVNEWDSLGKVKVWDKNIGHCSTLSWVSGSAHTQRLSHFFPSVID